MKTDTKDRPLYHSEGEQGLRKIGWPLYASAIHRHLRTPLYANAYYLMANTIILSLSGFLFWTAVARLYDPADVGIGSALVAASTLLTGISALGLGTGLIRFLPRAEDPWRVITTCLTIPALVSVLTGTMFLLGVRIWSPDLMFVAQEPLLFVCFVLFTAGGTLSSLVDNLFIAQRRAKYTLLKNTVTGFGRIPLLMWVTFFAGAFAIFGVMGLVIVPVVGVAVWWVRYGIERAHSSPKWLGRRALAELIPFSVANYVADLIYRAPAMLLPLLVLNMLGPEANGYFYISWMAGGVFSVVPGAMARSLFAEGSHFEWKLGGDAIRAVKLSLFLVLPAVGAAFLLADKLLLLFGGSYAEEGVSLLRMLVLAAVPIVLNMIYFTVKRVQKQITAIIGLSVLIAVGTLGLSYILMPHMGLSGVGIAWLVSQATASVVVALSLWKRRWARATAENEKE